MDIETVYFTYDILNRLSASRVFDVTNVCEIRESCRSWDGTKGILFFESGEVLDEFALFSFHLVQHTRRVAVNLTTSLIDFIWNSSADMRQGSGDLSKFDDFEKLREQFAGEYIRSVYGVRGLFEDESNPQEPKTKKRYWCKIIKKKKFVIYGNIKLGIKNCKSWILKVRNMVNWKL